MTRPPAYRFAPVEQLAGTFDTHEELEIRVPIMVEGEAPVFVLYREGQQAPIAQCLNARKLSDWALDHGASEVRHTYDLKLAEE